MWPWSWQRRKCQAHLQGELLQLDRNLDLALPLATSKLLSPHLRGRFVNLATNPHLGVIATGVAGATVDSVGRQPVGPSLRDVASGSLVPYTQALSYKADHLRKGFVAITIAPVGKQPAAMFVLDRKVNVKGLPRESPKGWYWSVTLDGYTGPENKVATLLHVPLRSIVTEECSLELAEGEFLVAQFAYK